ncbi:MAG: hypothetical protein M3Y36_07270 [Actinomycetota bacterium]|nr:hypothetical protein [Actinomycetota bacterium]
MSNDDDALDPQGQAPPGWSLDRDLEIAAEVYGPEPKGHRSVPPDLSDEEMVERFRSLLGFDVNWD